MTDREQQVLDRLLAGESTTDIAAGMFIAPATVRHHIQSIMAKTGTHSRVEAVAHARVAVDRGALVLAWCHERGWRLTGLTELLILQAFLSQESGCEGGAHQWPVRPDVGAWVCLCGAMTVG